MLAGTYPVRVLLMTISGLVNRHQTDLIAYLVEENRVLEEQMKGRKLRLNDDQRRRLAAKAKLLGRKALDQVATIVTPDTLMRWHRRLIALKSRCVHLAGITTTPNESYMAQIARNLTDRVDGFLRNHSFLILDRDGKSTKQFRETLNNAGVRPILTPVRAPNCNAFAERFVLSIKSECLGRMIFFGERSLRRTVAKYLEHYHGERAHQGLGNERIEHAELAGTGQVQCQERVGGLLKYYYRAA